MSLKVVLMEHANAEHFSLNNISLFMFVISDEELRAFGNFLGDSK